MSNRQELLESIAATITDYRADDLPAPTPAHVETWINQFDAGVQLPILSEIDHVLKNTYFSLQKVAHFLKVVLKSEKLAGADPGAFWRSVRFLDIQGGGNSQRDMLALFGELLKETHGIAIEQGGEESGAFVYLDDVVFTGNRVLHDLADWIQSDAPAAATVHVVSMALHTGGVHYARGKIAEVARTYGKSITVQFWSAVTLEDRKTRTYMSDVLRPVSIPEAPEVMEYVAAMKYKPELRIAGDVGRNKIFSSEAGRHVLEQEFLKAGVNIRQSCPNLGVTQRPLGHSWLETLGFGSLIVTFRNCPNNTPLALWVGDPWHPLFPRTTNSQASIKRLMAMFPERLTED